MARKESFILSAYTVNPLADSEQIKGYRVSRKGRRGYSTSLPPEWIRRNGLKPGDPLEIRQAPGSEDLVIRKADNSTSGQTTAREQH